jgi:putative endonuclease
MDQHYPCVYILTNKPCGVLYTGVTSNLPGRLWQHKNKQVTGFSRKYNTDKLVWYEMHCDIYAAITREKQIKKWYRGWKIELIESENPAWKDRSEEVYG